MVFGQDSGQLVDGPVKVVIDDLMVVAFRVFDLAPGVGQALEDGLFIVGPPGPEPGLESVGVGGVGSGCVGSTAGRAGRAARDR